MKIAMVAEHTNPLAAHKGEPACGDSVHIAALSRQLAKLGHRVTVYARRHSPALAERSRMGRGVTVEHLAAGPERPLEESAAADHTGDFARELGPRLAEESPDVLHAFGWTSGLAAVSAAQDAAADSEPLPIVQTFHSLNAAEQRAGLSERAHRARIEAAVAGRADHVSVNSSDQRFELARMGLQRDRVSVVPFGVDTDHFSVEGATSAETWSPRKSGCTRLVAVTDLAGGGADALLHTLRRLPDAELTIAAGPAHAELPLDDDARRLELLAKELGVDDRLSLTGPLDRKELPRLLRSADVFVSGSPYEPSGGAVLEAMACGLPVVARGVGSVNEAVLHGTTGTLLRTARPDALARAVRSLAAEPTMATAYGIAGSDRAASRFTWQRVAAETERVYQRACPGGEAELQHAAGDGAH
ncbi:glycosyltransferase [Streptomonospora litoralis]|uniref:D-inositol 3-phosphate glycosyltransferase n=1 Tax=Streptomonospora litoralis TaxID=2498135 RepID=A0A4P6PZJ0_9ACTN|nr:glycosyltransferase [Streptomonospora litoralis]QBI52331.1 D-inositol 3-phosphate glycosyltransferase [Streptomonospora litoralis]